ncbi:hypothetical protein [Brytella acorum]|nr:hypothetical protein [Brytella acorum]MDF3625902.1 hypothetical protein [Brytella acorum]
MPSRRQFFLAAVAMAAFGRARATEPYPVTHTDAAWHRLLTPAQ